MRIRKERVSRGDAHLEAFAIKLNDYINSILGRDLVIDVYDLGEIKIHLTPKITYTLILDRLPRQILYCKKGEVGKKDKDLFHIDDFSFSDSSAKSIAMALKEDSNIKDISLR